MALYGNIINNLGEDLSKYNSIGWIEFRNQMMADIKGFRIPFPTREWESESILRYNISEINEANNATRGNANFTYYTNEGPRKSHPNKPILANPDDVIKIWNDYKVRINDESPLYTDGYHSTYEYEENDSTRSSSRDRWSETPLDRTVYYGDEYITPYNDGQTLLSKTKRWFNNATNDYISKRYSTLISRFHTDLNQRSIEDLDNDIGVQAFSQKYGLSHGRNLLKLNPTESDGYNDPYCRVWKWHKQYSTLKDTIRPLRGNGEPLDYETLLDYNWDVFRSSDTSYGRQNGGRRLEMFGVLHGKGNQGLVNITPSSNDDGEMVVGVEKCMFSIENLAWKGTFNDPTIFEKNGLSPEQKGPLGGRIMWFPPYDIKFNESTQANWQTNEFIGRGEPIYTYANTQRSGSLTFKLLIDHPAILDYWERRDETGSVTQSGVDNVDSKEQELLRFFAGCSVLMADKSKYAQVDNEAEVEEKDPAQSSTKTQGNVINFFVFFPNNYSGVDDKVGGVVDPIDYLMNGVGCQKYTDIDKINDKDSYKDLNTDPNAVYTYNGVTVGGYEMRTQPGVSVIQSNTTSNWICDVSDNTGEYYSLVKMAGSEADKETGYSPDAPLEKKIEWNKRRYYYRADNDTLNQILIGDENDGAVSYIDKVSYQLNSFGYSEACTRFNFDQNTTYSMAEVYVALNGENNCSFTNLCNSDRVAELKKIFAGEMGEITNISCEGMASSQANNESTATNKKRNTKLAKQRAKTVRTWLQSKLKNESIHYASGDTYTIDANKEYNQKDSNEKEAKLTRCAIVRITYGGDDVVDGSQTNVSVDENGKTENNSNVLSEEATQAKIEDNVEENGRTLPVEASYRYDNEYLFFKKLTEKEPFIKKLLSERINNFDPVFHSMSPEGFNARLTFLNQCMRQGPTISSSDTSGMKKHNPNNLAFGRPPVCVLRVGDFYNTKIVITSMTIDYDPLVWDLNQEGIGVMPMIANITLQFNFIGGSDLGGPIQRLQNATSFNYYANAGVYDNRSEAIEYGDNGRVQRFFSYDPYIDEK